MLSKKASVTTQLFLAGAVAVLLTIGCTNSGENKTDEKPAGDTTQKMDTASIRPSKIPNQ